MRGEQMPTPDARMTENPTAAGLSEAERDKVCVCPLYRCPVMPGDTHTTECSQHRVAVESIVAAHVTAAEDRMREAVEGQLFALAPGDPTREAILAALAPTAHDAAPEKVAREDVTHTHDHIGIIGGCPACEQVKQALPSVGPLTDRLAGRHPRRIMSSEEFAEMRAALSDPDYLEQLAADGRTTDMVEVDNPFRPEFRPRHGTESDRG